MPGAHRALTEAVPILMYHVIGVPAGAPLPDLWVTPTDFRAQVRALRDSDFHGVTLQQVWSAWHHGSKLPRNPIVFSFDDGYEGQVRDALPALRSAGWPGVLNLVLHNLPDVGGTRGAKRLIAAGWEIDSHTLTHRDLTTLPDEELRGELRDSRARITRLLKQPASFFCYPSGRYDARVEKAVREAGYLAATTTAPGYALPTADPYALARVRVEGHVTATQLLQRLHELRAS
jgi:peptidoglycan/xylan/chitin deacetylase (PgdA/CDA1 family)